MQNMEFKRTEKTPRVADLLPLL